MTTVALAYHSGYGHTARLASAVEEGAASVEGVRTRLIRVDTITPEEWEALDRADAIIFGSPTYMGSASPEFHAFATATAARWQEQAWTDKLAGGFTNSGSKGGDKLHTLQYLAILAAQHGMHWVSLGLLAGWNSSTSSEHDLNRLGVWLGAAASSNVDEGPDAMHEADLMTGAHLGRRVAEQAQLMARAVR
ncbi:flavodoxin family protein [Nonomuraea sp. NPDC050556]|uniref:flavodoxin family protein n=1 Tax=Nonomuraea sp. NPDC050556 TaxID=3364369 RepID=UPI0037A0CF28